MALCLSHAQALGLEAWNGPAAALAEGRSECSGSAAGTLGSSCCQVLTPGHSRGDSVAGKSRPIQAFVTKSSLAHPRRDSQRRLRTTIVSVTWDAHSAFAGGSPSRSERVEQQRWTSTQQQGQYNNKTASLNRPHACWIICIHRLVLRDAAREGVSLEPLDTLAAVAVPPGTRAAVAVAFRRELARARMPDAVPLWIAVPRLACAGRRLERGPGAGLAVVGFAARFAQGCLGAAVAAPVAGFAAAFALPPVPALAMGLASDASLARTSLLALALAPVLAAETLAGLCLDSPGRRFPDATRSLRRFVRAGAGACSCAAEPSIAESSRRDNVAWRTGKRAGGAGGGGGVRRERAGSAAVRIGLPSENIVPPAVWPDTAAL